MPSVRESAAKLCKLATLPLAAAILIVLGLKVGVADTLACLRHVSVPLVAAAAGLSLLEETLKAWRWRAILGILGCRIAYREALFLIFANLPLRGVASSHAGDLSKAAYLKRWHDTSLFVSVSSMLAELGLSLLCLLAITAVGCIAGQRNPCRLLEMSVLGLCLGCAFLGLSRWAGWRAWVVARVSRLAREKATRAVEQALSGYARCGLRHAVALATASLILESAKLVSFFLVCRAVGVGIPFRDIVVFLPAVMVLAKLPFTPAGLGTREAAILFFFKDRASADALLATGVLFSFAEYIAPMLVGLPLVKLFLDRILLGRPLPSPANVIPPSSEPRLVD